MEEIRKERKKNETKKGKGKRKKRRKERKKKELKEGKRDGGHLGQDSMVSHFMKKLEHLHLTGFKTLIRT